MNDSGPTPVANCKSSVFNSKINYGTLSDSDGNVYKTVKIGSQRWMAENLKTTKYANGDEIPNKVADSIWNKSTVGTWAYYNNDSENDCPYGKLYNWLAVIDERNVCPTGWHVPSDVEWQSLANYVEGKNVAGKKLKSRGTTHWNSPNESALNSVGFSALPGGFRRRSGEFTLLHDSGIWWTSTEYDLGNSKYVYMRCTTNELLENYYTKKRGYSIRCIED